MKKIQIFILLMMCPLMLWGQPFQREVNTIPVYWNEKMLQRPFNGGLNTLSIAMPDIDNDGDFDLFLVGNDEGTLHFYRNDGNGAAGEFTYVTSSLFDFDYQRSSNRIAFYDQDKDGLLDLFSGGGSGRTLYLHNTGSLENPSFQLDDYIYEDITTASSVNPVFADLNNDGNQDLILSGYQNGSLYYQYNGGHFTLVDTLSKDSGKIIKIGYFTNYPAFVDIDADGDLDLFMGSTNNAIAFYKNIGTPESYLFIMSDSLYIQPPELIDFITPVFVDIDNDSDYDLFFGSNDGYVTYYRNDGTPTLPDFQLVTIQIPLEHLDFGLYGYPSFVDIDADSDLDLFVSSDNRHFHFFENIDNTYHWKTDNFLSELEVFDAAWGDVDNDGDYDILAGLYSGGWTFALYQNDGTVTEPNFVNMGIITTADGSHIEGFDARLVDIDSDGDLDLSTKARNPGSIFSIVIYKNIGTSESMSLSSVPDSLRDNEGNVIQHYDFSHQYIDFDYDGDVDLFVGTADGVISYYENIGSTSEAKFRLNDDSFGDISMGPSYRNLPFFVDIDNDNDLDVFVGRMQGGLFFYRNLHEFDVAGFINNVAMNKNATSSRTFEGNSASLAVDGDIETNWIAGEHPPQWIEIDLGAPVTIGKIELVVSQYPSGETVHRLYTKGGDDSDTYSFLRELRGFTSDLDVLEYVPYSPLDSVRYVKVETVESPSWVGWREIKIFSNEIISTDVNVNNQSGQISKFELSQNYPNPFNPITSIRFSLAHKSSVKLNVYNLLGEEIQTLVNGIKDSGDYTVNFDGSRFSSGVYIYRIEADGFVQTRKLMLVR